MKAIVLLVVAGLFLCAPLAMGQQAPMYDNTYRGPMNQYGHAVYKPYMTRQQAAQQPRYGYPDNGVLPQAWKGLNRVGNYLWQYMPAPVRGVEPQYRRAAEQGSVNVIFVPGSR